jgi:integrase
VRGTRAEDSVQPTGHLQVKGAAGSRRYFALWRDADGRHQRLLGPAHVKDSGRRTPRSAVIWRAGDGPLPSPEHLTPAAAASELRELVVRAPKRPTPPGERGREAITFGQACEEWLRYVQDERKRTPSTVADYRSSIRAGLLPAFGADTPLAQIDTEAIDSWRAGLLAEGRLAPRSIQKLLTILHSVLKRAKRRGWISANPAVDAERITVKRSGRFNVLSPVQVAALTRSAESVQDGVAFTVAAFTGLRLGELVALRWGDVDFAKRLVHVRGSYTRRQQGPPKSGRVRSVPLIDQALEPLDRLSRREHFTEPDDLVFVGQTGGYVDGSALRKRFYAALERAGLGELRAKPEPIRFHDLRHTFGTLAVQAFPLSDVKAYMGHADIQTTMIYVHHVPRHDAATRLSAIVGGETGLIEEGIADEDRAAAVQASSST